MPTRIALPDELARWATRSPRSREGERSCRRRSQTARYRCRWSVEPLTDEAPTGRSRRDAMRGFVGFSGLFRSFEVHLRLRF